VVLLLFFNLLTLFMSQSQPHSLCEVIIIWLWVYNLPKPNLNFVNETSSIQFFHNQSWKLTSNNYFIYLVFISCECDLLLIGLVWDSLVLWFECVYWLLNRIIRFNSELLIHLWIFISFHCFIHIIIIKHNLIVIIVFSLTLLQTLLKSKNAIPPSNTLSISSYRLTKT